MEDVISPCLASNESQWKTLPLFDEADIVDQNPREQLSVNVQYIGSTRYVPQSDGSYVVDASGSGVFQGARNFTGLTIPDHILAIGNKAFYGCQMKSIAIASNVKSIGNYAFYNCNQLTSVILTRITPPTIASTTFNNPTTNFYVPNESVEAYKTASNWSAMASRIYPMSELP